MNPFGQPVFHICAVSMQLHFARALQRIERLNGGLQLHAVIGGVWFAAIDFFLAVPHDQKRAPTARTRIATASAIRPNFNMIRHSVLMLCFVGAGNVRHSGSAARGLESLRVADYGSRMTDAPTAAICLIGDELLSGRTRDINTQTIALFLAQYGIPVREVRIVSDDQDRIVEAVNALRARETYVFTTGGIGPTHDDITADAIAAAFGVEIDEHPDALKILESRYAESGIEFTPARRRMARIPHGASLIENPVSGAPGFQTGNVFTLAGVPKIVEGMLDDIGHRLASGHKVEAMTVQAANLREGDLAERLGEIVAQFPSANIGSYPWFKSVNDHGVALVVRGRDRRVLEDVADLLETLIRERGGTPVRLDGAEGNAS